MGDSKRRKEKLGESYGRHETSQRDKYRSRHKFVASRQSRESSVKRLDERIANELIEGVIERGLDIDLIIEVPMIALMMLQIERNRLTTREFFEKLDTLLILDLKGDTYDLDVAEHERQEAAITNQEDQMILDAIYSMKEQTEEKGLMKTSV